MCVCDCVWEREREGGGGGASLMDLKKSITRKEYVTLEYCQHSMSSVLENHK